MYLKVVLDSKLGKKSPLATLDLSQAGIEPSGEQRVSKLPKLTAVRPGCHIVRRKLASLNEYPFIASTRAEIAAESCI